MTSLKVLIILLFISLAFSGYLTPQHIEEHIKRLIAQKYQLYVINLGTTVGNNALKAYVISGIKMQQTKISELSKYPATLITSYMHPRQPYSIKLMQKLLDEVLNNYETDYYFKYMLDNTLLILFPFVNIDGYYRYKQLSQSNTPAQTLAKYRKSLNKYGNCKNQWDFGVDINRNFDSSFGSLTTSQDQCHEQYRGPSSFSQKQSKAIKILFKKFHVTLAIDVHSYGNQWIYPYASQKSDQKLMNHKLYPIYEELKEKFKQIKRPMKSCFQSLGYLADGVYIDWALDQGALSFALEIGVNFNNDANINQEILFEVEESFHHILKKNSISYKKFLNSDHVFVVQSTSLLDFQVEIATSKDGPSSTQLLEAGKFISFPDQSKGKSVFLKIKNTIIEEEINFQKLEVKSLNSLKSYNLISLLKIFLTVIAIILLGLLGVRTMFQKQRQLARKKFSLPKQKEPGFDEQTQVQ